MKTMAVVVAPQAMTAVMSTVAAAAARDLWQLWQKG